MGPQERDIRQDYHGYHHRDLLKNPVLGIKLVCFEF